MRVVISLFQTCSNNLKQEVRAQFFNSHEIMVYTGLCMLVTLVAGYYMFTTTLK